ncbi:spore coat associated protein CotJA [Dorea sp. OM02-2LB]|nr:spore coat associated protein CotJA [Dorea sp. OM02-2LB]RGV95516.1 spore coat associated protein CotJA [Ruminococcus sp. AF14-10]
MRKDPLSQFPLAMAYVPWQEWREICDLEKALCQGTIFQELNLEFLGRKGGQMR